MQSPAHRVPERVAASDRAALAAKDKEKEMDSESLKSLGWLLLWGGLFYFMMRHGCGAHMMGGHGGHGHGGHEEAPKGDAVKDPVCGMTLEAKNAAAAAVRDGSTYYFCSNSCRDKFEQASAELVDAPNARENQHGGHLHG